VREIQPAELLKIDKSLNFELEVALEICRKLIKQVRSLKLKLQDCSSVLTDN